MLQVQKLSKGFTLIELMIVVAVLAVILLIAVPAYERHTRKVTAAQVQQEVLSIAMELERNKSRNFNYLGFKKGSASEPLTIKNYTITVRDGNNTSLDLTHSASLGSSWVILAMTSDIKNYNFLMSSTGMQCKNLKSIEMSYSGCGDGSEGWK